MIWCLYQLDIFVGLVKILVMVTKIEPWSSREMPQERMENRHTSDITLAQKLIFDYQFNKVKFIGIRLKQTKRIRYIVKRSKHAFLS